MAGKVTPSFGALNLAFLKGLQKKTRDAILKNIATHYDISREEAMQELVYPDAEHILDYMTGPEREATSLMLKRLDY